MLFGLPRNPKRAIIVVSEQQLLVDEEATRCILRSSDCNDRQKKLKYAGASRKSRPGTELELTDQSYADYQEAYLKDAEKPFREKLVEKAKENRIEALPYVLA